MDELFDITLEQATAVADILVELGLTHDDRNDQYRASSGYRAIVDWLHRDGARAAEFRCLPGLGFGGKLWVTPDRPPYVNGYAEDATARTDAAAATANERIAAVFGGRPAPLRSRS